MLNSSCRTNKADKNSALQWIKTSRQASKSVWLMYSWASKMSGGSWQTSTESAFHRQTALGKKVWVTMCWFCTGSVYIWFQILWWKWQLVERVSWSGNGNQVIRKSIWMTAMLRTYGWMPKNKQRTKQKFTLSLSLSVLSLPLCIIYSMTLCHVMGAGRHFVCLWD